MRQDAASCTQISGIDFAAEKIAAKVYSAIGAADGPRAQLTGTLSNSQSG
jgi:hypothetical protein